jgi:hypothetical protein
MKHSPGDHALALIKAALNLVPYAGGSLASLIGDYVPTSQQKALETATGLFREKLEELQDRVQCEAVNREDFADLFAKFQALAAKTNREVKLRAAANILANSLLPPSDPKRSPYDELDHLMHCADALSSGAVALLGASIQIKKPRHAGGGDAPLYFSELRHKLPRCDTDLILGLAAELRSLNLFHITEGSIAGPSYEHCAFRVTPLGSRFAERFIEGSM